MKTIMCFQIFSLSFFNYDQRFKNMQLRSTIASRPQASVQIRSSNINNNNNNSNSNNSSTMIGNSAIAVLSQKPQPTPSPLQVASKIAQASSSAQLKHFVTNNNVNINNNNSNSKNNNNKSQVSIAVVSSSSTSKNKLSSTTTTATLSSQSIKSNALSNSHLLSPTKTTILNNKIHQNETPVKKSQGSSVKTKEKKTSLASVVAASASSNSGNNAMSNFYPSTFGDDDINDVAAMGGVNLAEESQKILGSTEYVGTQIRSCKDEVLLNLNVLQQRIRHQMARHGLDEPSLDVAFLISHATQEYLKNITEKLSVISEHRMDILKVIIFVTFFQNMKMSFFKLNYSK